MYTDRGPRNQPSGSIIGRRLWLQHFDVYRNRFCKLLILLLPHHDAFVTGHFATLRDKRLDIGVHREFDLGFVPVSILPGLRVSLEDPLGENRVLHLRR